MHNLQSSKLTRAAFAAVLVLGSASLAAADAKAEKTAVKQEKAAPAAPAEKAAKAKIDPALAEMAAKEKITREKNDKDARKAYLRGLELRDKDMKFEQAIAEFLKAKSIWEGQSGIEPAKYSRDVEEVQKQISQAYYDWAKELYLKAERDAAVDKMDEAIAKCRQAAEMYPPCKDVMEKAIAKYEQKKRVMEFANATTQKAADPEMEERTENIALALQRGRAYYKIGRFDDARTQFNTVLVHDPYNGTAIDYLRRIYLKMNDVGKQRKDIFAAEAVSEAAWKTVAPILLPATQEDGSAASDGPVAKSDSTRNLREKLQKIKFKTLVFEDTPLDEVVKYLKRRSKEYDADKVGVNFVLRCSEGSAASAGSEEDYESEDGGEESSGEGGMPAITIYFGADEDDSGNAPEITLEKVIEAVCQSANLKYRVEDYAVVIADSNVSLEDYVTEFYTVEKESVDAAASTTDDGTIKAYFEKRGIKFDEGANAIFDDQTNKLIVVNTPQMQEMVQKLVTSLNRSEPQIQVQVKFVEISMNDLEELGFEYTVSREDLYSKDHLTAGLTELNQSNLGIVYDVSKVDMTTNAYQPVTAYGTFQNNTGTSVTLWGTTNTSYGDQYGTSSKQDYESGSASFGSGETITLNTALSGWYNPVTNDFQLNDTGLYYRTSNEARRRQRHSMTFGANERTLRYASTDPGYRAFGLEENPVNDTVFNWSRYTSAGYSYNAKVHALDRADSADTLSSPRVTTMNSSPAVIKMVTQKKYPESWSDSEINTTNGLLSFIPSIPEFSDAVEEGVQLEVTPEIADDEKYTLMMQMNPVILDFGGWLDYSYEIIPDSSQPPVKNTLKMPILSARSVQTNVVCYDRSTIVLGGIIKDKVSSVDDQYPILGDIPIVGRLFQSKGKGSQKTNLLIFLTASLVNSDGSYYRDNVERGIPQF